MSVRDKKFLKTIQCFAKICLVSTLMLVSAHSHAFDSNNFFDSPPGWKMAAKSTVTGGYYKNVHTYEKDGDFVALVDLLGGARVKMLQYQSGKNANGHSTFWTNTLDYWWKQLPEKSSRVLVGNAQYFDNSVTNRQTTLSYSVRSETWATPSGDPNAHSKPLRQIAFYPHGVKITQAVDNVWVQTTAPDGLLGRHPEDVDKLNDKIGRTHLCATQYTGNYILPENQPRPILLVYLAKAKTQKEMVELLKKMGLSF